MKDPKDPAQTPPRMICESLDDFMVVWVDQAAFTRQQRVTCISFIGRDTAYARVI
jgi:hypothetical protein